MIKEIEKYNTVLMLVRGYLRDNVKRYNTSDVFTIIAAYYMLSSLGTDLTKPFDHYANENCVIIRLYFIYNFKIYIILFHIRQNRRERQERINSEKD